jgi:hypothetical protein
MILINYFKVFTVFISLFTPFATKTNANNTYNTIYPSRTKRRVYKPKYFTGDITPFFSIDNFIVKDIGVNALEDFELSYKPLKIGYSYFIEYSYSFIDGDFILGDGERFDAINSSDLTSRVISFSADSTKFEIPYVDFTIYIECYKNQNNISTIYAEQFIDFTLVNARHEIHATKTSCDLPYIFSYNSSNYLGSTTYDLIIFNNFNSKIIDQLYFRIKPSNYSFSYYGDNQFSDVELIIYNNNSSFNNTLNEVNTSKPYFTLIETPLENNNFTLSYKSIEKGGYNDLFLDPLTGIMSKNRSALNYIKVDNIYLPLENKYKYEALKCAFKIQEFGYASMSIVWDVEFNFSQSISDFYHDKLLFGQVVEDPGMEEVIVG